MLPSHANYWWHLLQSGADEKMRGENVGAQTAEKVYTEQENPEL